MLVVAASSDKLSLTMQTNATIMVCIFGVICGNYSFYGSQSAISAIPVAAVSLLGMGYVGQEPGAEKGPAAGTIGAMTSAVLMLCLFLFGSPTSMTLPIVSLTKPSTWGQMLGGRQLELLRRGLHCAVVPDERIFRHRQFHRDSHDRGLRRLRGIPVGRYVPGLMGTLFSFVDKINFFVRDHLCLSDVAAIGFSAVLPTPETPYSSGIFWYPWPASSARYGRMASERGSHEVLSADQEKMEEIQDRIAEIKAEAMKG